LFIEQRTFIDEDEEYRDEEEARLEAEKDARRSKELEDLWRARLLTDVGERVAKFMMARGLVYDAPSLCVLSLLPISSLSLK
jgi:hypothetical protein